MRKTLLATTAALALGLSSLAMANPCSDGSWSCDQKNKEGDNTLGITMSTSQSGTYNASEVTDEAKVFQNSFNKTAVVAATKLDGEVSHVRVNDIGNTATNRGDASGGNGGDGGRGYGGKGGKAVAIGGDGGDGGRGAKGVGIGGDAAAFSGAKARGGGAIAASVGVGGFAKARGEDSEATGGNGSAQAAAANGGAGTATSGAATATAGAGTGSGGDGGAGGAGAAAAAMAGNGGNGTGGAGGAGGDGGAISVSAGTFDMSNSMASVGQSAAGIMVANQNSGPASLVQQGITVQANLTVGH
jgi:hypothetical protein